MDNKEIIELIIAIIGAVFVPVYIYIQARKDKKGAELYSEIKDMNNSLKAFELSTTKEVTSLQGKVNMNTKSIERLDEDVKQLKKTA